MALAPALAAAVVAWIGPADMAERIAGLDWRFLLAALAVTEAQLLVAAWRWRFTAARLGTPIPLGRAFRETALAMLLNLVLPGGVAGDALRAARASPETGARVAVRSVVLDRVTGQAGFVVVAAAGLGFALALGFDIPTVLALPLALVPVLALAAAAGLALAARRGPARVRRALAGLKTDLRAALLDRGALLVQAGTGVLLAVSYVAVFALAGHAIGAPLPLPAAMALIPLALLAMLVPVGAGGLGLREGAAALLWPLAGLAAADGGATAAVYGLVAVAGALPGLAALLPTTRPSDDSLSARTA